MKTKLPYWAGLYIALIAMVFRAFLPAGWMPAPSVQAEDAPWISFVICTSEGLVQLADTAGTTGQDWDLEHENNNARHSYAACPYATTAPLAPSVAAHTIEPHYVKFSPVTFQTAGTLLVAKDLFERERSRAPPFLNS